MLLYLSGCDDPYEAYNKFVEVVYTFSEGNLSQQSTSASAFVGNNSMPVIVLELQRCPNSAHPKTVEGCSLSGQSSYPISGN